MSPRPTFEQELKQLHEDVKEMGMTVEHTYDELFDAVSRKDDEMVAHVMKSDRMINNMQRNIEASCLTLITKQQPVARDLRLVTAALKVVTDIERIGDHCADIAELMLRLDMADLTGYSEHLPKMIEETKKLEHAAVDAFVNRDLTAAKQVILDDDIVDELFNKVKMDLVEHIKAGTVGADECVDVLMIAKYLEKIGDHAVNIGEWEEFQENGMIDDVRIL